MGYIRTNGVVIKEVNTGEADKIITILTKGQGKISAFAKSARRPKSSLIAGSQFLCYSDFVLFKGKDMFSINSSDVIESFYEIRNDIFKLTYSAHMVDIISDVIQENQPAGKVLQLFLNTLHMLAKTDKSPELLTRIFEIRLLSILGYAPYVSACINCSKEENEDLMFSFRRCGLICSACIPQDPYAVKILPGTAKALQHMVHSKMQNLFSFNLSQDVLNELARISKRYLKDRLERDYNKLDFLKSLDLQA